MQRKIYKYQLPIKEQFELELPIGAEIIRIDGLEGSIWLWALVDIKAKTEKRTFYMFKTGGDIPENLGKLKYLGCGSIFIQMELMLYIYEEEKPVTLIQDKNTLFEDKLEKIDKKIENDLSKQNTI